MPGQSIEQDVIGLKLKLAGDAVFDQDRWLPQIALGLQYKKNLDFDLVPKLLGAKKDSGTDIYLSATKLHLAALAGYNLLWNATLRATKANQLGRLGFGGDRNNSYRLRFEGSAAVFITDGLALGLEYRAKPDNLSVFREDSFKDLFVAWLPNKRVAVTVAYATGYDCRQKRSGRALSVAIGQLLSF